jgi:hypothetical protein
MPRLAPVTIAILSLRIILAPENHSRAFRLPIGDRRLGWNLRSAGWATSTLS